MEMIEQSQLIFGQIVKTGNQDLFATTEIRIVITNMHQEGVRQERRGEKVVMNDLKFRENFVWRYFVVLADNGLVLYAVRHKQRTKLTINANSRKKQKA